MSGSSDQRGPEGKTFPLASKLLYRDQSSLPVILVGWKRKGTSPRSQEYFTMPLTCVVAIVRSIKDVSVVELPDELQSLDQFLHKVINWEQSLPPGCKQRMSVESQRKRLRDTCKTSKPFSPKWKKFPNFLSSNALLQKKKKKRLENFRIVTSI